VQEAKVVVSATVEGSPGPVKAMVRLGSSIREAIAAVVERYDREGRSPQLDPASADSFQLHHSHFCLNSKPTTPETYYSYMHIVTPSDLYYSSLIQMRLPLKYV
jgi:hypothetical protein